MKIKKFQIRLDTYNDARKFARFVGMTVLIMTSIISYGTFAVDGFEFHGLWFWVLIPPLYMGIMSLPSYLIAYGMASGAVWLARRRN